MNLAALGRLIEARAAEDAVLIRLGRHCTACVLVEASDDCLYVNVHEGRVAGVLHGSRHMRSWQFSLRASDAAWAEFWQPLPRPGYNDIFALSRFGHLKIEGDMAPLLAHLRFFKRLLALPRGDLERFAA